MRAVFVNHCHPNAPHVCALRMTKFAHAMADRGHQIVLLTETLGPDDLGQNSADLEADLKLHDWSAPFYLAVRPTTDRTLKKLRVGALPFGIRQLVIAHRYFTQSGLFGDWRCASRSFLPVVSQTFCPDVVWASFGNTDVWNIARDLSRAADCSWVADLKDNWSAFLPFGFKKMIAERFNGAASLTAFSKGHSVEVRRWFKRDATVIYSGFDQNDVVAAEPEHPRKIVITGSLYDGQQAKILMKGFELWLSVRNKDQSPIEIHYAGGDGERFDMLAAHVARYCGVVNSGYLPLDDLRTLQASAMVNAYMYSPQAIFQHKPLELLSALRPILTVPDERNEVKIIAENVGGRLHTCSTAEQVADCLASAENNEPSIIDRDRLNAYSWQQQAAALEGVLKQIIEHSGTGT